MDQERKISKKVKKHDATDPQYPYVDPDPRIVRGLTRPSSSHPHVVLGEGGLVVTIADGAEITSYTLIHDDKGVEALPRWSRQRSCALSALVDGGNGRVVAIRRHEDSSLVEIIDSDGHEHTLTEVKGSVCGSVVAGGRLFLATRRDRHVGATLFEIDLVSGHIVSETPLASCNIDLSSSPSGNRVTISDRINKTISTRSSTPEKPCPPVGDPTRPPSGGPKAPAAPDPCGCHGSVSTQPQDQPGAARRPAGDDPCGPGMAGLPDNNGGAIVSDGNGVGKRPSGSRTGGRGPGGDHQVGSGETPSPLDCYGNLSWTSDRLRWAGAYVLATQGNYMRKLAVLRASDMRVLLQRDFGNQGALVFDHPTTEAILLYHSKRGTWEWLDLASDTLVGPLDRDSRTVFPFIDQKTFQGQQVMSLIQGHVPTTGEVRVIVLPVIEPGQTYDEPDLAKLGAYMQKTLFEPSDAFYRENSFNQTWLTFRMLGFNVGPIGRPPVLPKPVSAYFFPPFFAGGVKLNVATDAGPHLSVEGGQTLVLHAQPRTKGRQADDFTLRLCALSLVSTIDAFPVKLIFHGSEIGVLAFTDRNGVAHALSLKFPARTIQIDNTAIPAGLQALADFLDGILDAAEKAAGFAARVFAKPLVSRVSAPSLDFGELHIKLEFAGTLAGGPKAAEVTKATPNASLAQIGFLDAIPGTFVGASTANFSPYLSRLLKEAQEEKGYTSSARMFAEAVEVAITPLTFTATFLLSNDDGGPNAMISVKSSFATSSSFTLVGSESTKDQANAPKDMGIFINDAFSASLARIGGSDPVSLLNGFHVAIVGMVGAAAGVAPSEAWKSSGTANTADLREAQMMWTAVDTVDNSRQFQSRWILQFLQGDASPAALSHELGHAYGFRDLYRESAHRKDLSYLSSWAIMGQHEPRAHHAGYHKWQAGWIPNGRIVDVPKPDPSGPTTVEALLVPTEYWDDGMEPAVRAAFGGSGLPVAQLIRMDLGGDGGMFDLVEARQKGIRFSQTLPDQPALLVTNAIEPWDDTRYVLNDRYRRELHLLNTGIDLDAPNDEFNLGKAPALPAKGIVVKILDMRDVSRPSGLVKVFHIVTTREKADYIDLGFTSSDPYYKNPDLWIDWPGDNPGGTGPGAHRSYAEGEPVDQGEQIHVPSKDSELHWMVARVRNYGTVRAEKVKLDYFVSQPPGAGDKGNFRLVRSATDLVVQPGVPLEVPAEWDVVSSDEGHGCLLVMIADASIPRDSDGIVLGSDDVVKANNHAQKNFDEFVAASHSPFQPIEFDYSVNNDGVFVETAYLEPMNLSYGMKLTVSPVRSTIQPKETVIFHLTLELDDRIINTGCRNDSEFTLVTWRETRETVERWGAVHYKIRPRIGTVTTIVGSWYDNSVAIYGAVKPDPGPGTVIRVRINFDNQKAFWMPVTIASGGSYKIQLTTPAAAVSLDTEAMFEGNTVLAPSRSIPTTVRPYVIK